MVGIGNRKMVQTPTKKIPIVVNAMTPRIDQMINSQGTSPKNKSHRSIQVFNAITPTREYQFPIPLEICDKEKMRSKSCADSRK